MIEIRIWRQRMGEIIHCTITPSNVEMGPVVIGAAERFVGDHPFQVSFQVDPETGEGVPHFLTEAFRNALLTALRTLKPADTTRPA